MVVGTGFYLQGVSQNVGNTVKDSIWREQGNRIHNVDTQKNVGIGTDQPTRKLDVAGDARVRGLGGDSMSLVVSDKQGNLGRLPVERPIRDILQPTPGQNNKAAQALNAFSFYGNSGLDPSQHFLGMKDATDLVIRTNNTERMRVRADGVTEINDLSAQSRIQGDYLQGNNHRIAYVTPGGKLIGPGDPPATNGCAPPIMDGWVEGQDHDDIRLCSNFDSLGIGTGDPNAQLHIKKDAPSLLIEDQIQESGTDATARMTLKANDTSSSLASSHSIDMILKGDVSEERFKVVQQLGAVNTSSKKLFSVGHFETIVHNGAIFKDLSVFNNNATFKDQAHFKDITLFDQKATFGGDVQLSNIATGNDEVLAMTPSGKITTASSGQLGDNMGDHIADQNIELSGHYLSNDGDNEGIKVKTGGNVQTSDKLNVLGKLSVSDNATLSGSKTSVTQALTVNASTQVLSFALSVHGESAFEQPVAIEKSTNADFDPHKLEVGGKAIAKDWETNSDKRLKKNIKRLKNPISKIKQINGVSYRWKDEYRYGDNQEHIGLIAQEVEKVLPQLVTTPDSGYKSMSYARMVPLLIEAIKQQQKQIEKLSKSDSKKRNQGSGSSSSKTTEEKNREKGGYKKEIKLYQNTPNPFSTDTKIKYFLPNKVSEATLRIYNLKGKQLKTYSSLEKGNGHVIVNGGELYPGQFVYTLIADGQIIESKKMILTN